MELSCPPQATPHHPLPRRTCAGCPSIDAVSASQHPHQEMVVIWGSSYTPVVVVPDLVHQPVVATVQGNSVRRIELAIRARRSNAHLEGKCTGKDNAEHGIVPPEEGAGEELASAGATAVGSRAWFGRGLACKGRWPANALLVTVLSISVQGAVALTISTVIGAPAGSECRYVRRGGIVEVQVRRGSKQVEQNRPVIAAAKAATEVSGPFPDWPKLPRAQKLGVGSALESPAAKPFSSPLHV